MRNWGCFDAWALKRIATDYVCTSEFAEGTVPGLCEAGIPTYEVPCHNPRVICMDGQGFCLYYGPSFLETVNIYDLLLFSEDEVAEDFPVIVAGQFAKLLDILGSAAAINIFRFHHGVAEIVYEFTMLGYPEAATRVMAGVDNTERAELLQHDDRDVRLSIIQTLGRLKASHQGRRLRRARKRNLNPRTHEQTRSHSAVITRQGRTAFGARK